MSLILLRKNILKQINTKNVVKFNSKKFSRSFFDKLNLKFDLAYGRLNYSKKIYSLNSEELKKHEFLIKMITEN